MSAVAQVIANYGGTQTSVVAGTSVSAPSFAAILARINEERLGAGKATVGFVNATMYQSAEALIDITIGQNHGCPTKGFFCAEGWDPVTDPGKAEFRQPSDLHY